MSHRGEDGGGGSDVDGSGGGLLTCCTSAGLPPPPPPQPLLLHLLAPAARRTAVETSAGRSSDRRSDVCPDVSRPGRMSLARREKRASNQAAASSSVTHDVERTMGPNGRGQHYFYSSRVTRERAPIPWRVCFWVVARSDLDIRATGVGSFADPSVEFYLGNLAACFSQLPLAE